MKNRNIINERLDLPIKEGKEYKEDITWLDFKSIKNMLDTDIICGLEWKNEQKTPYIRIIRKREETDEEFFQRLKVENEEKVKTENREKLESLRLKYIVENEEQKSIKIKTNSWHSVIYKYWTGNMGNWTNSRLPNNLCSYFWKTLMYCILMIPFCIFCLPLIIFNSISSFFVKPSIYLNKFDRIMGNSAKELAEHQLLIYVILTVGLFLLYSEFLLSLYLFGYPLTQKETATTLFAVFINILIIFFFSRYYILEYFDDIKKASKDNSGEKPTRFGTLFFIAIKSKYNKMCPRITWLNDKDED